MYFRTFRVILVVPSCEDRQSNYPADQVVLILYSMNILTAILILSASSFGLVLAMDSMFAKLVTICGSLRLIITSPCSDRRFGILRSNVSDLLAADCTCLEH